MPTKISKVIVVSCDDSDLEYAKIQSRDEGSVYPVKITSFHNCNKMDSLNRNEMKCVRDAINCWLEEYPEYE